jgi:glucose/mannose transport system substrate-binding protein
MLSVLRPSVLIAGCLALASCSDPIKLDVYSWWRAKSEDDAFKKMSGIYTDAHPGVVVNNLADNTSTGARDNMAKDLLIGSPPSTFQANIGSDLLRWTSVDVADDGGTHIERYIEPLTGQLSHLDELESRLPKQLTELLHLQGESHVDAVPIDIHRLNYIYYNTARIRPTDLTLDALCRINGATGIPARFSMGLADQWSLGILVFENVLIGRWGPGFYSDLFTGAISTPTDWIKVQQAFECVQYLSTLMVDGAEKDVWPDSAHRVAQNSDAPGAADFTIGGDWINGEIGPELDSGAVARLPFPMAQGLPDVYVFTADTFPLPVGAPHSRETLELLETMAGPNAQAEFSRIKGSIPARTDAFTSLASSDALDRRAEFDRPDVVKVVATSGLFPPYYPTGTLFELVAAVMAKGAGTTEIHQAMTYLQAWEPLLAKWHSKLGINPLPAP